MDKKEQIIAAMSPEMRKDYENWKAGNHIEIGEFSIKPKGDIESWIHAGHVHGWVVCRAGCNAMPGAAWAKTADEATIMLHCFVAAGENGDRFWSMMAIVNHLSKKADPKPAPASTMKRQAEPGTALERMLFAALSRWQGFIDNSEWTDKDFKDADGRGWVSMTKDAIEAGRAAGLKA